MIGTGDPIPSSDVDVVMLVFLHLSYSLDTLGLSFPDRLWLCICTSFWERISEAGYLSWGQLCHRTPPTSRQPTSSGAEYSLGSESRLYSHIPFGS